MILHRLLRSVLAAALCSTTCVVAVSSAHSIPSATVAPSGCIVGQTTHFDVILLIDQSISLRDGGSLPRLREGLEAAARRFRFADGDDRVDVSLGVIDFGEGARVVQPLEAFDEGRLNELALDLSDLQGLTNYTDYVAALESAFDMFSAAEQRDSCRVLIWFTDGKFDVEQFNKNRPRDEAGYLRDRVCGNGGEVSLAQRAWSLGIATYALLIGEPPRGEVADASLHAMQAVSGDDQIDTSGWASATGIAPLDPSCRRFIDRDVYPRNRIGQVVVDSTELAVQLDRLILESIGARAVEECPFELNTTRNLEQLPAGLFLERVEITAVAVDGVNVTIKQNDGTAVSGPIALEGDRLSIGGDEGRLLLDGLGAGWSLTMSGNSRSVCVQLIPRSSLPTLVLEPNPVEVVGGGKFALSPDWASLSPSLEGPDNWRGAIESWLIVEDSLGEFASLDSGSVAPVGPESPLTLRAATTDSELSPLSDVKVVIVPAKGSGADAVTVEAKVSPSVEFTPRADAPSITCDEDLTVSASGDVPNVDEPLRSRGACQVDAPQTGVALIDVDLSALPAVNGVGWRFVDQDGIEVTSGSRLAAGGTSLKIYLEATEPFSDRDWLIVGAAQLEVTWSLDDTGGDSTVGSGTFAVEIDLSNRPNQFWAIAIAVLLTMLASLVSLSLLWLLNRRLVRLESADRFYYREAAIQINRDEATGHSWSPQNALSSARVDPVTSIEDGDDLTAGSVQIERVLPPFWAPFREPVAQVVSHAVAKVKPGAPGQRSCPLGFAALTVVVVSEGTAPEASTVGARVVHLYRRHVAQPDLAITNRDIGRMASELVRELPARAEQHSRVEQSALTELKPPPLGPVGTSAPSLPTEQRGPSALSGRPPLPPTR